MKPLYASALALIAGALPALAHTDGALPVHAHPHGSELLLAIPVVVVLGVAAYLYARR